MDVDANLIAYLDSITVLFLFVCPHLFYDRNHLLSSSFCYSNGCLFEDVSPADAFNTEPGLILGTLLNRIERFYLTVLCSKEFYVRSSKQYKSTYGSSRTLELTNYNDRDATTVSTENDIKQIIENFKWSQNSKLRGSDWPFSLSSLFYPKRPNIPVTDCHS